MNSYIEFIIIAVDQNRGFHRVEYEICPFCVVLTDISPIHAGYVDCQDLAIVVRLRRQPKQDISDPHSYALILLHTIVK
jgi:hypothetical protein